MPAKGMSRMDAIILRGSRVVGVLAVREGAAAPPLGSAKFRFSSLQSVVNDRVLGPDQKSVSCAALCVSSGKWAALCFFHGTG